VRLRDGSSGLLHLLDGLLKRLLGLLPNLPQTRSIRRESLLRARGDMEFLHISDVEDMKLRATVVS
jgi:hypothetical protein